MTDSGSGSINLKVPRAIDKESAQNLGALNQIYNNFNIELSYPGKDTGAWTAYSMTTFSMKIASVSNGKKRCLMWLIL